MVAVIIYWPKTGKTEAEPWPSAKKILTKP
jgi:hypothetical protein